MAAGFERKPTDHIEAAWRKASSVAVRAILPSGRIARRDRETLIRAGRLRRLMKGWYLLEANGFSATSAPSLADLPAGRFYDFLGQYLDDRLRRHWCLSAESSLLVQLDPAAVPDRIVVLGEYGSTTHQQFAGLTELTVYRDPDRFPDRVQRQSGLRMMSVQDALARVRPGSLERIPDLIARALPLVGDWAGFATTLAREGRHTAAQRLEEELLGAGMPDEARTLRRTLAVCGIRLPRSGASIGGAPVTGIAPAPPVAAVDELTGTWRTWTNALRGRRLPARLPLLELLASARRRAVDDALQSLRLAGFAVTRAEVLSAFSEPERAAVAAGDRDPAAVLALQGYVDAARLVRKTIVRLLEDEPLAAVLTEDVPLWHRALLTPAAEAGLFPAGEPGVPRPEAAGRLALLWELAAGESDPGARALAVHLGLVRLRPWAGGTGRLARLAMNALLTASRLPWRTIGGDDPDGYAAALAEALGGGPLAGWVAYLEVRTD